MRRALSKNQRWLRIEQLLARQPTGVKVMAMAEELGVHRATLYRDIDELSQSGLPIWQAGGQIGLLVDKQLSHLRLNIFEALSLFVAARLLCRQSGEHDPHVVSMLEKLESTLPAPVSEHLHRSSEIIKSRPKDTNYVRNLEVLMLAWVYKKRVRMEYQSAWRSKAKERLFDVYFIEPLEQVYSCYVIGMDHLYGEVRTFKVKRIRQIELLDETYELQKGFDIFEQWANSWGIVMAPANEPVQVRLRFSRNIAFMIKESRWHHTQQIQDTDDGGCIFEATVDHTMGIKIWIRTWGADVEVLAPESLRKEVAYEVRLLHTSYCEVNTDDINEYSGNYHL